MTNMVFLVTNVKNTNQAETTRLLSDVLERTKICHSKYFISQKLKTFTGRIHLYLNLYYMPDFMYFKTAQKDIS